MYEFRGISYYNLPESFQEEIDRIKKSEQEIGPLSSDDNITVCTTIRALNEVVAGRSDLREGTEARWLEDLSVFYRYVCV